MPNTWQQNLTQPVDEENMKKALEGVVFKGETPSCAARKYGLKRTAILYRLLQERKKNTEPCTESANVIEFKFQNAAPPKHNATLNSKPVITVKSEGNRKFKSKFTSYQLLSAKQEELLSDFLKHCYKMKCEQSGDTTVLSEAAARQLVYNFVRVNNISYPSTWEPKLQAGGEWFDSFVDRNPEVIEYVAPAFKPRKKRRCPNTSLNSTNDGSTNQEHGQWAPQPPKNVKSTQMNNTSQYDQQVLASIKENTQTEKTCQLLSGNANQFIVKIEHLNESQDSKPLFSAANSCVNNTIKSEALYNFQTKKIESSAESIAKNVKIRTFGKQQQLEYQSSLNGYSQTNQEVENGIKDSISKMGNGIDPSTRHSKQNAEEDYLYGFADRIPHSLRLLNQNQSQNSSSHASNNDVNYYKQEWNTKPLSTSMDQPIQMGNTLKREQKVPIAINNYAQEYPINKQQLDQNRALLKIKIEPPDESEISKVPVTMVNEYCAIESPTNLDGYQDLPTRGDVNMNASYIAKKVKKRGFSKVYESENSKSHLTVVNESCAVEVPKHLNVYQDFKTTDVESSADSIAQNVKKRAFRKPRIIPEIVYSRQHTRKDICGQTPQQAHNFEQKPVTERQNLTNKPTQGNQETKDETIQEAIEKMRNDMNGHMQVIITQLMENNRLLTQFFNQASYSASH